MVKLRQQHVAAIQKRLSLPDGSQIVLVEPPTDGSWATDDVYLNIFRIADDDELIWRVSAPRPANPTDAFVALRMDGGRLLADRFFGSEYEIDQVNGAAEEIGWHK